MKVLVCLKHVLDHQLSPRIQPDGLNLDLAQQKMSINPFDEVALEQAVRLKEAGLVQEVHVVCCGPAAAQNSLRTALALGADHAQLLETDAPLTPRQISKHLAMLIQEMRPDLVLCGKQACDDDAGQVPQMLAGRLTWPQLSFTCRLTLLPEKNQIEVERLLDEGLETRVANLPAIVSCELQLNTPRYASLAHIMKAKKKPLEYRPLFATPAEAAPRLRTLKLSPPPARPAGKLVPNIDALLQSLQTDPRLSSLEGLQ